MTALMAAAVWALTMSAPTVGQPSRCADCHYANRSAPNGWHRDQWSMSPHGRAGVGCDRCHGGDPETFDGLFAHRGILRATAPSSPVYRANLPATCGSCHIGPFVAFKNSWHFQLLRADDARGPTCTTCHGEVEGYRLTPAGFESQCAACHGVGQTAPRIDRPREAAALLQGIRDARDRLARTRTIIRRNADGSRRTALDASVRSVEARLIEATDAIHRFSFDMAQDHLDVVRQRLAAIGRALAESNDVPE